MNRATPLRWPRSSPVKPFRIDTSARAARRTWNAANHVSSSSPADAAAPPSAILARFGIDSRVAHASRVAGRYGRCSGRLALRPRDPNLGVDTVHVLDALDVRKRGDLDLQPRLGLECARLVHEVLVARQAGGGPLDVEVVDAAAHRPALAARKLLGVQLRRRQLGAGPVDPQ